MTSSHCTGTGITFVQRPKWKLQYDTEMIALAGDRERDQNLLFPIVSVPFPAPVPVHSRAV